MNRQHYDLLIKIMYNAGTVFSQETLAGILDVSSRSIRNYVNTINEVLSSYHLCPIQIYPNGDISFDGGQLEVLKIQQFLFQNDFYQYKLSSAERTQIIIFLLLLTDGYMTSTSLAEKLYVSKTTLVKDIEAASQFFSEKGISFSEEKTSGYLLEITEEERRELLLEYVDTIALRHDLPNYPADGAATGVMYAFIMQQFNGTELVELLRKAVYLAEADALISLSDREYQSIIHGLLVLLSRIQKGSTLQEACGNREPGSSVAAHLSSSLSKHIEEITRIHIPPQEQAYITYTLEHHWLDRKDYDSVNVLEVHLATKQFIYSVSKELNMELYRDDDLQHFLAKHLQKLLERRDSPPLDPALTDVKKSYQDCYAAVEKHFGRLESALGHRIGLQAQDTILLYITAAVERFRRKQGAPKVIIVCGGGVATARFLSEKLLRNFIIDVVNITSVHRIAQARSNFSHDLIITTVPLQIDDVPCVWVSPALSRKDMLQIYDVLQMLELNGRDGTIYSEAARPGRSLPAAEGYDLFAPDAVAVRCRADTWQDAIRQAGDLLPIVAEVKDQYIKDMIQSVEDYGPYIVIVPGVALAHAAPPAPDVSFCASMACFDPPVSFHSKENDPVRCVIALQSTNKEEHIKKLFQLMNLVCTEEFRQQLQSTTKEELLQNIHKYCSAEGSHG